MVARNKLALSFNKWNNPNVAMSMHMPLAEGHSILTKLHVCTVKLPISLKYLKALNRNDSIPCLHRQHVSLARGCLR